MFVLISACNYFYMIEIIRAVRSIIPAAKLTFLFLRMYLYSKIRRRSSTFSFNKTLVINFFFFTHSFRLIFLSYLPCSLQSSLELSPTILLQSSTQAFPPGCIWNTIGRHMMWPKFPSAGVRCRHYKTQFFCSWSYPKEEGRIVWSPYALCMDHATVQSVSGQQRLQPLLLVWELPLYHCTFLDLTDWFAIRI